MNIKPPLLTVLLLATTPLHAENWQHTVILIYADVDKSQQVYIRGGVDWDYSARHRDVNCYSNADDCAIPIKHNLLQNHVEFKNDHFLDWYGAEELQEDAEGTPLVWTTNISDGYTLVEEFGFGYTEINTFGEDYWMMDVEINCSNTVNGWFEFKAFIKNGEGWEPDINDPNKQWHSNNHFARCGHLNVYHFGDDETISMEPID